MQFGYNQEPSNLVRRGSHRCVLNVRQSVVWKMIWNFSICTNYCTPLGCVRWWFYGTTNILPLWGNDCINSNTIFTELPKMCTKCRAISGLKNDMKQALWALRERPHPGPLLPFRSERIRSTFPKSGKELGWSRMSSARSFWNVIFKRVCAQQISYSPRLSILLKSKMDSSL